MSDILQELRGIQTTCPTLHGIFNNAADEIERLRKALQEIVQVGGQDLCRGIAAEALALTNGDHK